MSSGKGKEKFVKQGNKPFFYQPVLDIKKTKPRIHEFTNSRIQSAAKMPESLLKPFLWCIISLVRKYSVLRIKKIAELS